MQTHSCLTIYTQNVHSNVIKKNPDSLYRQNHSTFEFLKINMLEKDVKFMLRILIMDLFVKILPSIILLQASLFSGIHLSSHQFITSFVYILCVKCSILSCTFCIPFTSLLLYIKQQNSQNSLHVALKYTNHLMSDLTRIQFTKAFPFITLYLFLFSFCFLFILNSVQL